MISMKIRCKVALLSTFPFTIRFDLIRFDDFLMHIDPNACVLGELLLLLQKLSDHGEGQEVAITAATLLCLIDGCHPNAHPQFIF